MASGINAARGFQDILPPDSEKTSALETLSRAVFSQHGFREIRIPTLESQELFVKSTGATTDIVEKEMFQLEDQGGRKLALRPEGTPGVVRAFLNNHLRQEGRVTKLFYIGNMFRAERPQAGRYREFEQIGAETLGNPHPAADVETILALKTLFDKAGLAGKTNLRINNLGCDTNPECRLKWCATLKSYLKSKASELCGHCQSRIDKNPLRALDCKADAPKLAHAPKLLPCAECMDHFQQVGLSLAQNGFPHLAPDPKLAQDSTLVRGLDYYTRTVFEFTTSGVGAQDALAGGGRYDGLVASMGGPDTPAVGWALGVERTLLAAKAVDPQGLALAAFLPPSGAQAFVATQGDLPETVRAASAVLASLRAAGIQADGGLFASSLKAQMREAGRKSARFVILLGERELSQTPPRCVIKEMQSGKQQEMELTQVVKLIANQCQLR